MEKADFEVSLDGDKVRVKREFVFNDGASIDLDISFTPRGGKLGASLLDLHRESIQIAIQHLQSLVK